MTISVCVLQDWALGVLHAKIIAAITLMGPQWWLKTVIEQVSVTFTQPAFNQKDLLGLLMIQNVVEDVKNSEPVRVS